MNARLNVLKYIQFCNICEGKIVLFQLNEYV